MPSSSANSLANPGTDPRELRRVVASSSIGVVVEYYDFTLYVTAASLVFDKLFFNNLPPAVATLASLGTLAVGYIARPLGGLIFGQLGDRVGRKSVLVATLILMGVATALVGVLPTQDQIGVMAPILLIVLRLLQGISIGGEWGGASLMLFEHAPVRRRGLLSVFTAAGGSVGVALASGTLALFSLLPQDQFMAWGWRIPFLASAALVGIGLWIRLKVSESPLFKLEQQRREQEGADKRPPLMQVFRHPRALILCFCALLAPFVFSSLNTAFGLVYARNNGLPVSAVLGIQVAGALFCAIMEFVAGWLSDIYGRKAILLAGIISGAIIAFPFLLLVGSGSVPLVLVGFALNFGITIALTFGPLSAFVSEQFQTSHRYTGASLGYQAASTLGGGFAPLILFALLEAAGGGLGLVIGFILAVAVISGIATIMTKSPKEAKLDADLVELAEVAAPAGRPAAH